MTRLPSAVADYRLLIESLVADPPAFTPTRESATAVQVERGTALAAALAGRPVPPLPAVTADVVDAAGHRRPVYRPLLVHACRRAGPDVGPWLASLSVDVGVALTAANGAAAAAAVWSAVALQTGSAAGDADAGEAHRAAVGLPDPRQRRGLRPADCNGFGSALFRRLVAEQQPSGALLRATPADNPETHWFHELVILHAAADFALASGDAAVWAGVARAAAFHLNETEPDHATGDPWGLPAFVRLSAAAPLADVLLHAVSAHRPGGAGGVGLLLLADTLYGLRHPAADAGDPEDRPR